MPGITAEELTAFMQRGPLDAAAANLAVDLAWGTVTEFCGWSIIAESDVEMTTGGDGTSVAMLPTAYLTAVSSLTLEGVELTDGIDFTWTSDGVLYRPSGWPYVMRSIVAVVDHGYSRAPDTARLVGLSVASRIYDNPTGERSRAVGASSSTFVAMGAELTEGERARLARGGYTLR